MQLKAIKQSDGDSKKSRVLVEFDAGTVEYEILKMAQAKNFSVSATLKEDVSKLVKDMGVLLGYKASETPAQAPSPKGKKV